MPNPKILVIDSDRAGLGPATALLEQAGFHVEVAVDGHSGLQAFATFKPDLVVLEAMLPKMHGLQVCEEIKKKPEGLATPILMTTASRRDGDFMAEARTIYGYQEYLEKPFSGQRLVATCRRILGDAAPPAARLSAQTAIEPARGLTTDDVMARLDAEVARTIAAQPRTEPAAHARRWSGAAIVVLIVGAAGVLTWNYRRDAGTLPPVALRVPAPAPRATAPAPPPIEPTPAPVLGAGLAEETPLPIPSAAAPTTTFEPASTRTQPAAAPTTIEPASTGTQPAAVPTTFEPASTRPQPLAAPRQARPAESGPATAPPRLPSGSASKPGAAPAPAPVAAEPPPAPPATVVELVQPLPPAPAIVELPGTGLALSVLGLGIVGSARPEPSAQPVSPPPIEPATPVSPSVIEVGPVLLQRTEPDYPALARRLGQEGTVVLDVLIDAHGRVTDVRLVRGIDRSKLNEAAIDAVRSWRYAPATRQGVPIEARRELRLDFKLAP